MILMKHQCHIGKEIEMFERLKSFLRDVHDGLSHPYAIEGAALAMGAKIAENKTTTKNLNPNPPIDYSIRLFTKRQQPKFCVNCKNCLRYSLSEPLRVGYEDMVCLSQNHVDLVTGEIVVGFCRNLRRAYDPGWSYGDRCGQDGQFFEAKEA